MTNAEPIDTLKLNFHLHLEMSPLKHNFALAHTSKDTTFLVLAKIPFFTGFSRFVFQYKKSEHIRSFYSLKIKIVAMRLIPLMP